MSQSSSAATPSPSTQKLPDLIEKMIDVIHELPKHVLKVENVIAGTQPRNVNRRNCSECAVHCWKPRSAERNSPPVDLLLNNSELRREFQKAEQHVKGMWFALPELETMGIDVSSRKILVELSSKKLIVDGLRDQLSSKRENHRSLMQRLSEEMFHIILDGQLPSKKEILEIILILTSKNLILEKKVELKDLKELSPKAMIQKILDITQSNDEILEGCKVFEQLRHKKEILDILEQLSLLEDLGILERLLPQETMLEIFKQLLPQMLEDLEQLSSELEDLVKQLLPKDHVENPEQPSSKKLEDLENFKQRSSVKLTNLEAFMQSLRGKLDTSRQLISSKKHNDFKQLEQTLTKQIGGFKRLFFQKLEILKQLLTSKPEDAEENQALQQNLKDLGTLNRQLPKTPDLQKLSSEKCKTIEMMVDQGSSEKLEDLQQLLSIKMMLKDLKILKQLSSKYMKLKDLLQLSSEKMMPADLRKKLENLGKMMLEDVNISEQLSSKRMMQEDPNQNSSIKMVLDDLNILEQLLSKRMTREDLLQLSSKKLMPADLRKLMHEILGKITPVELNIPEQLSSKRMMQEDLNILEQLLSKRMTHEYLLQLSSQKLMPADLRKMMIKNLGKIICTDLNTLEQLPSKKRMTSEDLQQLSSKKIRPVDLGNMMFHDLKKLMDEVHVILEQLPSHEMILKDLDQLSSKVETLEQLVSFLHHMESFLCQMETIESFLCQMETQIGQQIPDSSKKILEEIRLRNETLELCLASLLRTFDSDNSDSHELDTNKAFDAYFLVGKQQKENMKEKIQKSPAFNNFYEDFVDDFKNLDTKTKLCFLCFSALPEEAVVKKRALLHWWIGEGFIDSHAEADEVLKNLVTRGFIQPDLKKQRLVGFKMDRLIRAVAVKTAEEVGFLNFNEMGAPGDVFSWSHRACLVQRGNESSRQTLMNGIHPEKLHTVFNVNDHYLDFKKSWFSKLKNLNVLCLGGWQGSDRSHVEVESTEFLTDLKIMKYLRVLSLRSISRITELPDSVCSLSSLLILDLKACHNLEKLPRNLKALKNLTHLDLSECYLLDHIPEGLSALKQLQVFKGFVVGDSASKNPCQLEELAELENLRKLSVNAAREDFPTTKELTALQRFMALENLTLTWRKTSEAKVSGMGGKRLGEDRGSIPVRPSESVQSVQPAALKRRSRRASTDKATTPTAASASPAKKLQKLELRGFLGTELPTWLTEGKLKPEKKLYISGGKLRSLCKADDEVNEWSVKILRLKFLKGLEMGWSELRNSFKDLVYLEMVECPKLRLFPCNEDGLWLNLPRDKKLEYSTLGLTWFFLQRKH